MLKTVSRIFLILFNEFCKNFKKTSRRLPLIFRKLDTQTFISKQRVQIFLGQGFSGSRFFMVQVFLGPGFFWSRFFRVQVFQGLGPGFRSRREYLHCADWIPFYQWWSTNAPIKGDHTTRLKFQMQCLNHSRHLKLSMT